MSTKREPEAAPEFVERGEEFVVIGRHRDGRHE
jgi:hypothetical protein